MEKKERESGETEKGERRKGNRKAETDKKIQKKNTSKRNQQKTRKIEIDADNRKTEMDREKHGINFRRPASFQTINVRLQSFASFPAGPTYIHLLT